MQYMFSNENTKHLLYTFIKVKAPTRRQEPVSLFSVYQNSYRVLDTILIFIRSLKFRFAQKLAQSFTSLKTSSETNFFGISKTFLFECSFKKNLSVKNQSALIQAYRARVFGPICIREVFEEVMVLQPSH